MNTNNLYFVPSGTRELEALAWSEVERLRDSRAAPRRDGRRGAGRRKEEYVVQPGDLVAERGPAPAGHRDQGLEGRHLGQA